MATLTLETICDRQHLIDATKARQLGLDAYMSDRLDMYRITVTLAARGVEPSKELSFFVEPDHGYITATAKWGDVFCLGQTFSLSPQFYTTPWPSEDQCQTMRKLATTFFEQTPECQTLIANVKALAAAGYFEDGQYPGKNTGTCPHCKRCYKRGTSHDHVKMAYGGDTDKIITHNHRQHAKILAAGLTCSWAPGGGDEPSLEDQGVLERVVIE